MRALVLAGHLPGEPGLQSRYQTHVFVCPPDDPYAYCRKWQSWWGSDRTLVNVEHDMEVSDALITKLLRCRHPFCTYAYPLYHPGRTYYAQRRGHKPPAGGEWIAEGERWCDFTGIGLCKLTPEARVRPLHETEWSVLDCAISKATDARVHVHWPAVAHYHPM